MAVFDDLMKKKSMGTQRTELHPPVDPMDTEPVNMSPGAVLTPPPFESPEPVAADTGQEITPVAQPAKAAPEQKTFRTRQDIISELRKPAELSPEELEKERKRERNKAKILAVTDAINAISDLWATTRGAARTEYPLLAPVNRQRYADRLAAREKQQQEYIAALEKAGMDDVADEMRQQMQGEQLRNAHEIAVQNRAAADARAQADREQRAAEAEKDRIFKSGEAGKQREFTAGQNAANRAQRQKQTAAQQQRARSANIRYFHESQGDEIPFILNGKTYVVGSKALDANVGNFARNILEDARNSPQFKDKTDKELLRDTEWNRMTRDLTLDRDPKRLAQAVKSYAKYSPATVRDLEEMARHYSNGKRTAEQTDDYDFYTDTESDESDVMEIFD